MFKQSKEKAINIVKAKETKVRPRLNGMQRLKECALIIGVLASVLMMVALLSFNPADPSWSQTSWNGTVHNAGGYIGAWLADTLFFTFGLFAYLLPFIVLGISWALFRTREEDESIDLFLWGTRLLGLTIILLTSCGLADINFDDIWYFSSGGVIGDVLTSLATPALNILGSTLVFMFFWGAGFTLLTGISWLTIVEHIGQWALGFMQRLFNRGRGSQDKVLSATQYNQAELNNFNMEGIDHQDLSLQPHAQEVKIDEQVKVTPPTDDPISEEPVKKSPRFNIHFPRKAEPKSQQQPVEPYLSEDEVDDPLFTAPSVSDMQRQSQQTHGAETSQQQQASFQTSEDAGLDQPQQHNPVYQNAHSDAAGQTKSEDSGVSHTQIVDHTTDSGLNNQHSQQQPASYAEAQQPSSSTQSVEKAVVAGAAIAATSATNAHAMPVQPAASVMPEATEPFDAPWVQTEAAATLEPEAQEPGFQAVSTEASRVQQTSTPDTGTEQAQTTGPLEQPQVQPSRQEQPQEQNHQAETHVVPEPVAPELNQQPVAQATQHVVPEPTQAVEPEKAPDTDADSAAFQNMVSTAQANAMASQNPFLIQNDANLPVPTEPMPTLELLYHPEKRENHIDRDALEDIARLVESKLADYKIEARVVDIFPGPVITRFELDLAPGVKVSRISGLSMDLARSLSAMAVRVVEVIPGKPYVGLELPNMSRETVYLSDVISSQQFQNSKSPTAVVLGQDIAGEAVIADLAKMPHVLVAGTTGSGKSVGVNVMILSILYKATPEDVRFIMIDPKMLELSIYEGIPHLLSEVVTDMKDASNALRWCVGEMERRYKLLSAVGVRNIKGYNEKLKMAAEAGHPIHDPLWKPGDSMDEMPPLLEKLPSIVVIVDEFADLIMVVGKKVEELIARLAQKARAAGIHLVLATQRPSVDVITGLIKANIPTRVAFTVSTKTDSRTILDQGGAESLLGMGDMLYLPPGSNHPIRVHGAFASDEDVHAVVNDWKARGKPVYIDEIVHGEPTAESLLPGEQLESEADVDPLYDQVVEFVTESRRGSVSGVQRRFKIGYNRAARIVEQLEAQGVVSSPGHNGNREVIAPPPIKQFDN